MSKKMKVKLAIALVGAIILAAVSITCPEHAEAVARAFMILCTGV